MEKSTVPVIKSVESGSRLLIDGPRQESENESKGDDTTTTTTTSSGGESGDHVEILRPDTIIPGRDVNDGGKGDLTTTTTATPATTFVLVLGHHEVPDRLRSKFSPHFGIVDDPHSAKKEKDFGRIVKEAETAVYPAIKNAVETPFPLLEGTKEGDSEKSDSGDRSKSPQVTTPTPSA